MMMMNVVIENVMGRAERDSIIIPRLSPEKAFKLRCQVGQAAPPDYIPSTHPMDHKADSRGGNSTQTLNYAHSFQPFHLRACSSANWSSNLRTKGTVPRPLRSCKGRRDGTQSAHERRFALQSCRNEEKATGGE